MPRMKTAQAPLPCDQRSSSSALSIVISGNCTAQRKRFLSFDQISAIQRLYERQSASSMRGLSVTGRRNSVG